MNIMSNFKMPKIDIPKIDTSILPSASDLGINTGEVKGAFSDITDKLNLKDAFDLSQYPNVKDKVVAGLSSISTFGHFSLISFIPDSFFDQIDTEKVQGDIDNKLSGINLGSFGTLKLPDDIGSLVKDVMKGKGVGFMSLYTMPSIANPYKYNFDSSFNMDEMTSEINQISDIASDEFDMNSYMNEFSDISL